MYRRLTIIAVTVLVLTFLCVAVASGQRFKPSPFVYRLKVGGCGFGQQERVLTGFRAANKKGIVTALHGIADCGSINAVPDGDGQGFNGLKIREVDIDRDVAVVSSAELDSLPAAGLSVHNADQDIDGGLTLLGYPLGLDKQIPTYNVPVTDKAPLRNFVPANAGLRQLQLRHSPSADIEVLSVRAHILPGHSGAPLLDQLGNIVGIANGGLQRGTVEISWAIAWSDVEWKSALDLSISDRLDELSQNDPQTITVFESTFPENVESDDYFSGRIVDAATQDPIKDAEVTIAFETRYDFDYSDSEGVFAFAYDQNRERRLTLLMEADGYESQRRTIVLGRSMTQLMEFRLRKDVLPTPVPSPTRSAAPVPVVQPTAIPTSCAITPSQTLAGYWLPKLGCASGPSQIVWASYTPFEHGFMMWRSDTRKIYGFFSGVGWTSVEDQFREGMPDMPANNRGEPPPGLIHPIRGTGLAWASNPSFYSNLGWATQQQRGFCAEIQSFTNGFIVSESGISSCIDLKANEPRTSRAGESGFNFRYVTAASDGSWYP